jgi:hypothetical protein
VIADGGTPATVRSAARRLERFLRRSDVYSRAWSWRAVRDIGGTLWIVVLLKDRTRDRDVSSLWVRAEQFGVESLEQSLRQLRPH